MCRKPTACPVETCGVSFLLSVEGKTERKSRLSSAGRVGNRQPTHLLHQKVLLYVVGHRIPDGNSLWRAKKSRSHSASAASRHRYRCQAGVRWQMGSVVSVPSLAAAACCGGSGPVYLGCRCMWVWRHTALRGHPCRSSSCSASCRRVAPCWRQPCRSSSLQTRLLSARCSFRMQDPPACTAFVPLPGGRVTNVAAVTAWAVLAAAHDDAGTSSLLPAPGGSAGSSLFPLSSFLCSPCYVTPFPLVAVA